MMKSFVDIRAQIETVQQTLRLAGLDLSRVFDASRYNAAIVGKPLEPLPLFGRNAALALAVGNTRALWPAFIEACREQPHLRDCGDPLDRYVVESVERALVDVGPQTEAFFSHESGARRVAMVTLASESGLAAISPAQLAIDAEHGLWIALRAVIVMDATPLKETSAPAPSPCEGCAAPCKAPFERAMAAFEGSIADSWRHWVAVRDACPVGRHERYSDDQLRYHYTKDRALLDRVSAKRGR
jgi:methylmalonic aciduria homocystinuria type C protein